MLKRVAVVAALALLGSCGVRDADLVAKVNGDGITKKEFEAEVERNLARYKGQGHELPPGIEVRIRESVLRRMIDDKITELKAKGMDLAVSNEELEAKFKEHKDRFRTAEAFDDYLKRSGNTVENMKDDLKRNLLRDRVVEKLSGTVDVTDDEVKKYYDENVQRFTDREQVKASRVLVRLMPDAKPAEKAAALAEAKAIYAQLKKKDADFAAIAKDKSKGPEAANGGDLGWLTRGRMTPEFDLAVFGTAPEAAAPQGEAKPAKPAAKPVKGLEAGEMTPVVETKLGYEIVKVLEKKGERQRPLDEVKESIKNSLLARKKNEKRRDVLRALKADAKVEQLVKFDMPPMPQMGGPTVPPAAGAMPMPPGHPGMGGATPMPAQPLPAQVSPVPAQPAPAPAPAPQK
jgi:parvulin-like peptidyl-prolyl isomerase